MLSIFTPLNVVEELPVVIGEHWLKLELSNTDTF
jgi:hypothetical protein